MTHEFQITSPAPKADSLASQLAQMKAALEQQIADVIKVGPNATSMEVRVRALLLTELRHLLAAFTAAAQSAGRINQIATTLERMEETRDAALAEVINEVAATLPIN